MRVRTLVLLSLVVGSPAFAQPSTDLGTYVLFAEERITAKGYDVYLGGNVGVNSPEGILVGHKTVGPRVDGDLAVNRVIGAPEVFETLYANVAPPAYAPTPFTPPIVPDIAAACGMPDPFPACDRTRNIKDAGGMTLEPGVYGNVTLRRGWVTLQAGSYVFCNLKLTGFGGLAIEGSTVLNVTGSLINTNRLNDDGPAENLQIFVAGSKAKLRPGGGGHARVCAPNGTADVGISFSGRAVARRIKAGEVLYE